MMIMMTRENEGPLASLEERRCVRCCFSLLKLCVPCRLLPLRDVVSFRRVTPCLFSVAWRHVCFCCATRPLLPKEALRDVFSLSAVQVQAGTELAYRLRALRDVMAASVEWCVVALNRAGAGWDRARQTARRRWGGYMKGWLWGKDAEGLGW